MSSESIEEIARIRAAVCGKRVASLEFDEWKESDVSDWQILNLRAVIFDDGTRLELAASDYDNLVSATLAEAG